MNNRNIFIYASCVFILLATFGCTKLAKEYPTRNYYALSVNKPDTANEFIFDKVLEISSLTISPNFGGREFIYKLGDNRFDSDFYNQFFKSPSSIIFVEISEYLKQKNLFSNVIDTHTPVHPDYVLYGNIMKLYGDYSVSPPQAVLAVEFYLVDESTIDSAIIFNKAYNEYADLGSKSAKLLVEGWNKSLESILKNLEKDLKHLEF